MAVGLGSASCIRSCQTWSDVLPPWRSHSGLRDELQVVGKVAGSGKPLATLRVKTVRIFATFRLLKAVIRADMVPDAV